VDSIAAREVGVDFSLGRWTTINGIVSVLPTSQVQAVSTTYANGAFRLTLPTADGKKYFLEYTDQLPGTNWTAMPAVVGDGTVKTLIDPAAAVPQRFYRVRVE
jgi:hypothetical protein